MGRDADRRTTVRHAVAELVVRRGFVRPGETRLNVVSVTGDVLLDARTQGLAARDDVIPATGRTHLLGREVGVCPGAVPVTLDGLRGKRDVDFVVFGDALEQPARHHQLVGNLNGSERTNLELPLAHHHFRIRAFDGETGR